MPNQTNMILIAILFPGLSFLLRGKVISAMVAIVLQVVAVFTFIIFGAGAALWIILAIWAVTSYNQAKSHKRNKRLVNALKTR